MNASTLVGEVVGCEAFKGFGPLLFPAPLHREERRLALDHMEALFPRHRNICVSETLRVLNFMLRLSKHGVQYFYDIYSEKEKRRTSSKAHTGLFFFRGVRGAPFALITPGCGEYVATLHEGLPCAVELIRPGYNAFTLQYRPGGLAEICEDLAAAISFIFSHAEEFGVAAEGYALWGSSAGADAAAYLASYGPRAFGGDDLPRPCALVMQYSSHSNHTRREPPTFACTGGSDRALSLTMKKRIDVLASYGIDTEFHEYPQVENGFGLGTGTEAEGWLQDAVVFWKRHLPPAVRRLLRRKPAVRLLNRLS